MHVGGRENNLTDEILGHAHAEDIQFGFLRNLVPPVMHPPPGTIDKVVVCPSRAIRWRGIFIPHTLWVGRGRNGILWEGLAVIIHLYSLRTKLSNFLAKSSATEYVWQNIRCGGKNRINRRGGSMINRVSGATSTLKLFFTM